MSDLANQLRHGAIIPELLEEAAARIEALETALRDTLCELTACAGQLAARGLPGHEGDSVSRAQALARAALSPEQGK